MRCAGRPRLWASLAAADAIADAEADAEAGGFEDGLRCGQPRIGSARGFAFAGAGVLGCSLTVSGAGGEGAGFEGTAAEAGCGAAGAADALSAGLA